MPTTTEETITLTRDEAEAIAMLIHNLLPKPELAGLATAVIFAGNEPVADAFFSGMNKLVEPFKREFRPKGSQVS